MLHMMLPVEWYITPYTTPDVTSGMVPNPICYQWNATHHHHLHECGIIEVVPYSANVPHMHVHAVDNVSKLVERDISASNYHCVCTIILTHKATVTLRRGLTRCPRFEQNSRNRQSASERLQPPVLIRAVCLHTETDEKWRTHTVEIVCERLNRV